MGNIVVINCTDLSPLALKLLGEGEGSLQRVLRRTADFPDRKKTVLLISDGTPGLESLDLGDAEVLKKEKWSLASLFSAFCECSDGFERLFYLYGDTPLMDIELTGEMFKSHKKYFAQYSFADGYPLGLTPEILDVSILPALKTLAEQEDGPIDRKSVFTVLSRDINSFDIETKISPDDQRLLRISLTADTKRNFLLMKRLLKSGVKDVAGILSFVREHPDILRTLPAYVEVQVASGWLNKPEYLPEFPGETFSREDDRFLDPVDFALMMDRLESLSPDMVVNPGFRCEPSLHPDITEIFRSVLDKPGFRILVETSGLGWKERDLTAIGEMDTSRISWIVELDSAGPDYYGRIRGNGFEEAEAFALKMMESNSGRVWVQAVRLKGHEKETEAFYRKWKERTGDLIIQKYNDYCGVLPPRKVTDLSPMTRFPCWHLKRDIVILQDGTVLPCAEFLDPKKGLGSILHDSAETLWKLGENLYLEHTRENYPSLCGACDEYYTFNF